MSVSGTGSSLQQVYGIKNKGIGGLVSGLDTDSLVEALTSGTRSKIAKQGQDRQLLSWKMTAYRGMATALSAFQTKYLKYGSSASTVISSPSFFNTYKATSSSDKVSIKTSSSSLLGDFTIDKIQQLATAEKMTNKVSLSTSLESNSDINALMFKNGIDNSEGMNDFTGRTLVLDVNGDQRTIKLDSLNGINTETAFAEELQSLVDKAYGTKNVYNPNYDATAPTDPSDPDYDASKVWQSKVEHIVSVTAEGGKLKIDSDAARVFVARDADHLGLKESQANRVLMSTKLGDIDAFKNITGDYFKFEINGVEISISKNDTLNTLKSRIETSNANVRFDYNQYTDEFTITSKKTGAGENIVMRDTQGDLMNTLFGVQGGNGVGSKYLTLSSYPTADRLINVGGMSLPDRKALLTDMKNGNIEFSLTIDGVTKIVTADISAIDSQRREMNNITSQDYLDAINKGIKNAFGESTTVQFKSYSDGVKLEGGAGVAFAAKASTSSTSYNALGTMGFDGPTGNAIINMDYNTNITADSNHALSLGKNPDGSYEKGVFDVTINGVTKQLSIYNTSGSDKDLQTRLNDALTEAFGKETAKSVSFAVSGGKVALNTTDSNTSVTISQSASAALNGKTDIYAALGFDGTSVTNMVNPSNNSTTLGELSGGAGISGTIKINTGKKDAGDNDIYESFDYDEDTKLQDLINNINEKMGSGFAQVNNGQLVISDKSGSIDISDNGTLLKDFFGIESGSYTTQAQSADLNVSKGKNAEIVIDGRVISSASNTFTINGVEITATNVSAAGDAPIKVSVTSDPNEVVDKLKTWIDDYNALVATLNTAINEEKNKNYPPLTDEQKAEMTQDQIKTWEAEAQKGVLRNDGALRGILGELRESLYKRVEAAGISLYDIGITTKGYTGNPAEAGQIELTEKGEQTLRKMLENDPDKVRMLFTDPADGLAARMNSIIDRAAKTSSVNRGTLITLAGTDIITGDNTSTLGNKIDAIDKYITTLKTRLETEYNNYWSKFSSLETYIQRLSAQSSWLQQAGA